MEKTECVTRVAEPLEDNPMNLLADNCIVDYQCVAENLKFRRYVALDKSRNSYRILVIDFTREYLKSPWQIQRILHLLNKDEVASFLKAVNKYLPKLPLNYVEWFRAQHNREEY